LDQYALLAQSGLFDVDFYRREYGDVQSEPDLLRHYIARGAGEGRDPNLFFDTDWYAAARPTLAREPLNPLAHYQLEGAREGRDPSPFFQTRSFEAEGRTDRNSFKTGLAAYLSRITRSPWEHVPKGVVYTAVFAGYDDQPHVAAPDPRLRYILFTDKPGLKARSPWEIRAAPRMFADPQLDARRIKILPHLLLPDFDVSLWIDANSRLLRTTYDDLRRLSECADFVLRRHALRSCLYREADSVLWHRLDARIRVKSQIKKYRAAGFPEGFGLHQTAFVIRRHQRPESVRFAKSWWAEVYRHSKRDQLSFDFVRWDQNASVLSLYLNYTNNSVLEWTRHKRRNLFPFQQTIWPTFRMRERGPHRMQRRDASYGFLVAPYEPRYDEWERPFLLRLKSLNAIAAATRAPLAGNLCYFDRSTTYLHAPPDPRRGPKHETLFKALAGKDHLFEIGFNAGHSALLALERSAARVTSLDAGFNPYTPEAAEFLRREYPDRFGFLLRDSRRMLELRDAVDFTNVDLYHIDGGHSARVFRSDIAAVLQLSRPGAWILVDDFYLRALRWICGDLVRRGFIRPIAGLGTRESAAFEIVRGFAPPSGVRWTFSNARREKIAPENV
jgi:hypothetical protein